LLDPETTSPVDAWNSMQVFYMSDLAKAYGEVVCATEFSLLIQKELEKKENSNQDN